jgi:CcmD family protein
MIKRVLIALWSLCLVTPVWAMQPPKGGEFVPIDELPPSEQLPSAPLLVAAYAFVWLAVMFYVWTVWRRLNKVETELRTLEHRRGAGTGR